MYPLDAAALKTLGAPGSRGLDYQGATDRRRVAPAIWLLGLVSCFTDISSEMVASILPVYLFVHLQLSPLEFGVLDGLYQGVTAVARLAAGVVADRWQRHKFTAVAGYGLSALCKLGLLAVGPAFGGIAAVLSIDRIGKGIRTAPRDALIALHATRADLAASFGVHRALDAAGVVIGPLLAFAVLRSTPGRFDAVFVTSFSAAMVGLALLVLLVDDKRADAARTAVPLRDLLAICRDPRIRWIATTAALSSVAIMSDAFLYLILTSRAGHAVERLPLLYVGTALVFLALAVPLGRWADRRGRARVFVGGHLLMVTVYGGTFLVTNTPALIACLALHGVYYAATDGVLAALASHALPDEVRATGLAALATVTSLGRLCGSVLLGLVWTWQGPAGAAVFASMTTLVVLVVAAPTLIRSEKMSEASA